MLRVHLSVLRCFLVAYARLDETVVLAELVATAIARLAIFSVSYPSIAFPSVPPLILLHRALP